MPLPNLLLLKPGVIGFGLYFRRFCDESFGLLQQSLIVIHNYFRSTEERRGFGVYSSRTPGGR